MRPLMATFLQPASAPLHLGRYDEAAGLTVNEAGIPVALTRRVGETVTESSADPTDLADPWLHETLTKVASEPTDDMRLWADVETRTSPDVPDPRRPDPVPLRDDLATGVVAF